MIEIKTLDVTGFGAAIAGMRNPYKNRDKSDTVLIAEPMHVKAVIGPKDMELAQKLIHIGGDDDAKFLRMIHVQADIRAPLYWWKEFDTYKVATVANSESTMHTITRREFTIDDFAHENMTPGTLECLHDIVVQLNRLRNKFCNEDLDMNESYQIWYSLIQLLPSSYMQLRTVDLNYQTIRRMYNRRQHHKLKEWSGKDGFCGWVKTLPYAKEFLISEEKENER